MMDQNPKPLLGIAFLVLLITHGSHASFLDNIRKLGGHPPKHQERTEISPSPAPVTSPDSGNKLANEKDDQRTEIPPAPGPNSGNSFNKEQCLIPCQDRGNITACLTSLSSASEDMFLIVKNVGENSIEVNITFLNVKNTYQQIQISGHQTKKVTITANPGDSGSIVLNAGNGECNINLRSSVPYENIFQQFPSYATPINAAYLLFLMALIIGVTWTCCKLGKRGRQVDGIPYQELEMGQPDSLSVNNVETAEGWDEDWDDDWDETKAVKSPSSNKMANVSANGSISRSSDRDGWENYWDD